MRCFTLSAIVFVSSLPLTFAADPPEPTPPGVKLTADPPKPSPGKPVLVDAEAKSPVLWRVRGEATFKVRGNTLFLTTSNDPVTVLAYVAVGDQVVETVLILTPETPPKPPEPIPPADPLVSRLQAAYDADLEPSKASDVRKLAILWDEAATFAQARNDLTTAGQLLAAAREAAATLVPTGRLTAVRQIVGSELSIAMPTDPETPLTPGTRTAAAAAFRRIGIALSNVKTLK